MNNRISMSVLGLRGEKDERQTSRERERERERE